MKPAPTKGLPFRLLRVFGTLLVLALVALSVTIRLTALPADLLHPILGTTTLVDCHGRKLAALASTTARAQQPLTLKEMGRLPAVTVALEDSRFYSHHGVDLGATAAAIVRNLRARRIVSGGSTITQQLIKLSSGRSRRSWSSKIYENLAAMRLEQVWSKECILEEYLNRSHYGNREVGPAAAAAAYFLKKPENLSLAETIYLAGLPQAPTRFNPWRQPERAKARYTRALDTLRRHRAVETSDQIMVNVFPAVQPRPVSDRLAPHFVDYVLHRYPDITGGKVETTLDLELQGFAERELKSHLATLASRRVQHGAIVVLDTKSGAVRAMVGSAGYNGVRDGQINGGTTHRSCGSTLKPFLYLRAIDDRTLTAATLLPDTPDAIRTEYVDYDPVNYDNTFGGPTRVREALANSLNVPAVVTLSRVGARKAYLALQNCGLRFARSLNEYGAGLILGNADVRLIDLTAAFTVFSCRGGLAVDPQVVSSEPIRHRFIASPEATSIVADVLADNEARRQTFGPFSPLAFDTKRIPCKTGTSSGFRDAWAIGVTREHAVGVWVGNFDGSPMDEVASVTGAAPVWRAIIDYLLEHGDTPVPPPIETARLRQIKICALTGLLPVAASPRVINEWFLAGTEPRVDAHEYFRIIGGQPRVVLPSEYAIWCRSGQNHLGAVVDDRARLKIISPHADATFVIDPHLALSQQQLRLIASADITEELRWKVDGQAVDASRGGYFWPLIAGQHTAEVFGSRGYARSKFRVE